jgi:hypothetical protein
MGLVQDESSLDFKNKYLGRVTKNTGIKKYNQRMLKEIGNIHSDKNKEIQGYNGFLT